MDKLELSGSALAQGSIASRFQSQDAIDESKARKEEEWKAAYERIGQEAPRREEEPIHDGRTLYERLQIQKQLKTEEWDNKMKLGNQYRGLSSEEHSFLMQKAQERKAEEKKREEAENAEVTEYRERLAARNAAVALAAEEAAAINPSSSSAVPATAPPTAPAVKQLPPKAAKKDIKSLMKGVVVKKKPKTTVVAAKPASSGETTQTTKRPLDSTEGKESDEAKKQKTESS